MGLGLRCDYLLRVQDCEVLEPLKVSNIECENSAEAVDHHGRYQTGVMSVLSLDLIPYHQLLPLREDGRSIVQKSEKRLEPSKFRLCLSKRHPQPILGGRASADNPEFIDILRNEAKNVSLAAQLRHRVLGKPVHRVARFGCAGQDIGIDKGFHSPRPA